MPLDPTPIRKRIFEFPTPNLSDRVFHELHDSTQMNYTIPQYGALHPNQNKYEGFKLAMIKPANESGWVYWFYLNERLNQDEYNFEIQYPYPNTDYPVYVRTYVLPRSSLPGSEPAAGSEYPVGSGLFLTDHKQVRLQDPLMDSLFVGVQRVYERLPGPEIFKYRYNERGDLEEEINQVVSGDTMPDPDGLTVMESLVNHESTVKGTRKVRTVESHTKFTSKKKSDDLRGATVTTENEIVSPDTNPETLSLTTLESQVVQRTKTKAEKTTVSIDSWPTLTSKKYSEDARGAKITTTSTIVEPTTAATALSKTIIDSSVVQRTATLAEKTVVEVDSWPTLTSKSYPAEYKGAVATSVNTIVDPGTVVDTPGLVTGGAIVESQVVQRSANRAEKTTVTIDGWPTLTDYFFDNEVKLYVKITTEVIPASDVAARVANPPVGSDVEIRAIDKYWSTVITRTLQGYSGVTITENDYVEFNLPAVYRSHSISSLSKAVKSGTKLLGYTGVFTAYINVRAARRVYAKAKITTTLQSSTSATFKTPTTIEPVDVHYNGVLFNVSSGPMLTSGFSFTATAGSTDYYWPSGLNETYTVPASNPTGIPDTVQLPTKVIPWKYGLYKVVDTELDLSPFN